MEYKHIKNVIVKSPVFSKNKLYRYCLEIEHTETKSPGKTVCIIMQNPSIADGKMADRTIKILENVVFKMDFRQFRDIRRLIVVNQFAKVQTKGFKGLPQDVGTENDKYIKKAFRKADIIVIAWGKSNRFTARQKYVKELLSKYKGKEHYKTSSHPSRACYDKFILPLKNKEIIG